MTDRAALDRFIALVLQGRPGPEDPPCRRVPMRHVAAADQSALGRVTHARKWLLGRMCRNLAGTEVGRVISIGWNAQERHPVALLALPDGRRIAFPVALLAPHNPSAGAPR